MLVYSKKKYPKGEMSVTKEISGMFAMSLFTIHTFQRTHGIEAI